MSAEKRRRRGLGRSDAGRARRVSAGRAAAAPSAARVGPGPPGLAAGRPRRVQVGARGEDGRAWTGPGEGAGGPLRARLGARTTVRTPRERRGRCRRSGTPGAGPGPGPGAGGRDGDPQCPPARSPRQPRCLAPRVRARFAGRPPIWRARRGLRAEGLLTVTAAGLGEAAPGSPRPFPRAAPREPERRGVPRPALSAPRTRSHAAGARAPARAPARPSAGPFGPSLHPHCLPAQAPGVTGPRVPEALEPLRRLQGPGGLRGAQSPHRCEAAAAGLLF